MRRLLFDIVTFGERPEVAQRHAQDWFEYTDEFRCEHSSPECVFEFLRGAFGHVIWRVTGNSEATLLPLTLMLAVQIAVATVLIIMGDLGRFGVAIDLMLIGVFSFWIWFSLRRPWDLSFRWSFAIYLMVFGMSDLFAALTVSPATPINVVPFFVSGLGAVLLASSAMRQRLILGSSLTAMIVVSFGAFLSVSRWTWDTRGGSVLASVGTAALSTFLVVGLLVYLWRVWRAGQLVPQLPAT